MSLVSESMECILEMDLLWQDFIPHIAETFISQALSNFHLAHSPSIETPAQEGNLNSLENLYVAIHRIKILPFKFFEFVMKILW